MTPKPKPDAQAHPGAIELLVPDGPWMADEWLFHATRTDFIDVCSVATCDEPAFTASSKTVPWPVGTFMCRSHDTRWRKAGKPLVVEWIEEQANAPRIREFKHASRSGQSIDFRRFPEPLRTQVRFGIAQNQHRWRSLAGVRKGLAALAAWTEQEGITDLSEMEPLDLTEAFVAWAKSDSNPRRWLLNDARSIVKGIGRSVWEAYHPGDPWAASAWDQAVHGASTDTRIYWKGVTLPWLHDGLRAMSKEALQSRSVRPATVVNWTTAAQMFCRFGREVLHREPLPSEVDRPMMLDFLAWVNSPSGFNGTRSARSRVNVLVHCLTELRAGGYVEELPDSAYLLKRENRVPKTRAPRPLPEDVLQRFDQMIAEEEELTVSDRRLLRLFREGGPRPSEAVSMPIDVLRVTSGGHFWIEYEQSKTESWRRFPITNELGEELREQQDWVRSIYGTRSAWLFPGPGRSKVARDGVEGVCMPWTASGFRKKMVRLFIKWDIRESAITGEQISGGALHRHRHTIGTLLINHGWSQQETMEFLGHQSPQMTHHYTLLDSDRLSTKFRETMTVVNADGVPTTMTPLVADDAGVEHLRDRLAQAVLPNGFCGMPAHMSCDFRPTPCLNCAYFRTTPDFLPVHIRQRDEAQALVDRGKAEGQSRVVELNEPVVEQLNVVIDGLIASMTEVDDAV